jgi:hypothetical protein
MNIEILIQNGGRIFKPAVRGGVQWVTERIGSPSRLRFSVLRDDELRFTEGNPVRLKVDGVNVFYGFVFTQKRKKEQIIEVVAYDQLRYLKNKDTYRYKNKTASDVIKMIASDFRLKTGTIEDTGFVIPYRSEDNTTLLDIIYTALDMTLMNRKTMFVFFDDFGRLSLRSLESMKIPVLIDEETGENFDYTSSIDSGTYNRVKLSRENRETGRRDIYIAYDTANMNAWGVLQKYDTLQEGENGQIKADTLLTLHNARTRNLKIEKAFGDVRVRAGTLPVVNLDLGDMTVRTRLLVERAVHTFSESEYFMDLSLRGGEFVG